MIQLITRKRSIREISVSALAFCCLSLAGTPLFAQKGFDVGIRLATQSTWMINNTDFAAGSELNYKPKTGMGIGVSGGYSINKHYGVEIGFLYSKQGESYTGDVANISSSTNGVKILSAEFKALAQSNSIPFTGSYTADVSLTCIKIPILFRMNGKNTKRVYSSSFIGPQINMLSSVKDKINGQSASFAKLNTTDKNLYKSMTMDFVFGTGININITENIGVGAHIRLDYSLGDVENKSYTLSGSKVYDNSRAATHNATGGLMISANYKFIKKSKGADKSKPAPPPPAKKK